MGWTFNISSVSSLASGCILCFLDMRIHATQASHLKPISIAGEDNYMVDVVSHAFQKGKLFAANKNLTAYFKTHSPLPQGHYCTEFTSPPKWKQRAMLCLLGERLTLGSLLMLPRISKNTGRHGNAILPHGTWNPSSKAVTSLK